MVKSKEIAEVKYLSYVGVIKVTSWDGKFDTHLYTVEDFLESLLDNGIIAAYCDNYVNDTDREQWLHENVTSIEVERFFSNKLGE